MLFMTLPRVALIAARQQTQLRSPLMATRPIALPRWWGLAPRPARRQEPLPSGGSHLSLLVEPSRLLRFATTGAACGALQILLLHLLTTVGWYPVIANAAALLLSAQLNFVLSSTFTWRDRRDGGFALGRFARRWAVFHGSVTGTGLLNLAVFSALSLAVPSLIAAAAGIGAASLANYLLNDRLVFGSVARARRVAENSVGGAERTRTEGAASSEAAERGQRPRWALPGLVVVSLLAGYLYFWDLSRNGMANQYYAAAVLSGTLSWRAFLFGSLDPAGFITVDKPPFAFWVQALTSRVFGFGSWSILAPQALAGIASVLVVHRLVRRSFGDLAGIVAALVLALTPVTVAVSRDNLPDGILVLLLVLAAWAVLNAMRSGRLLPALVGAALVGVAFNTKMLQAYVVVPAFGLAYLLAARASFRRRVGTLLAASAVLAIVSASWMLVVDSIPADARPYVGGSADNTVLNLALSYNGLGRILGRGASLGDLGGIGGPGGGFGGQAGWLRLFNTQMATQISWLLPLAVLCLVAGVASRGLRPWSDERRGFFLLWGGWLAAHAVVFSLAEGIVHPYYTTAMGPAVAALVGAGLATLWDWYRDGGILRSLALPAAVALGSIWPAKLASSLTWGEPWLRTGIVVAAAAGVAGLLVARLFRAGHLRSLAAPALAASLVALTLAPGVWSVATVQAPLEASNPLGGPAGVAGAFGRGGRFPGSFASRGPTALAFADGSQRDGRSSPGDGQPARIGIAPQGAPGGFRPGFGGQVSQKLLDYLLANRGGATYIVAVSGANAAAPLILRSGQPVMAMGGFIGSDPAPTLEQLQGLVESGKLRFVLEGGGRGGWFGRDGGRSQWVAQNCAVVDPAAYGGATGAGGDQTLYDCRLAPGSSVAQGR